MAEQTYLLNANIRNTCLRIILAKEKQTKVNTAFIIMIKICRQARFIVKYIFIRVYLQFHMLNILTRNHIMYY